MKRSILLSVALLLVSGSVTLLRAQQEGDVAKDEAPVESDSPAVQKARAELRAAKSALDQAVESNQRVPGSFSSDSIEDRKLAVELAELRLKNIQNPDPKLEANLKVRYQRAMLKLKENRYRRALDANNRAPGAVAEPELKQLRLDAEAAKLAVEQAKNETVSGSAGESESEAISELRNAVAELRKEVESLKEAIKQLQNPPASRLLGK